MTGEYQEWWERQRAEYHERRAAMSPEERAAEDAAKEAEELADRQAAKAESTRQNRVALVALGVVVVLLVLWAVYTRLSNRLEVLECERDGGRMVSTEDGPDYCVGRD